MQKGKQSNISNHSFKEDGRIFVKIGQRVSSSVLMKNCLTLSCPIFTRRDIRSYLWLKSLGECKKNTI